jgi:hypothetical protein
MGHGFWILEAEQKAICQLLDAFMFLVLLPESFSDLLNHCEGRQKISPGLFDIEV